MVMSSQLPLKCCAHPLQFGKGGFRLGVKHTPTWWSNTHNVAADRLNRRLLVTTNLFDQRINACLVPGHATRKIKYGS